MGRVIVLDEGDRLSFVGNLPDAIEYALSSIGTVYVEVTEISYLTELEQRQAIDERDKTIAELQAIANRPFDGDMNTLIDRCEKREPLSMADQREIWAWLEERGAIIGDMQDEIDERDKTIAELRSAIKSHNARVKSDCERRCRANQIYGKHHPTECPLEYEIDVKAKAAESEAG